jgi:hypothetical protein
MKKFATVLIVLTTATSAAFGCSCKRTLIFGDVKRADLIFTGSVQNIEKKYLVEVYEYESSVTYDTIFYYEFEFIVKKSFKGKLDKETSIIVKSGGSTCSLNFKKGTNYLVYTSEVDYHFDIMEDKRIEPYYDGDYCSRTKKSRKTWPHEWMYLFMAKIF